MIFSLRFKAERGIVKTNDIFVHRLATDGRCMLPFFVHRSIIMLTGLYGKSPYSGHVRLYKDKITWLILIMKSLPKFLLLNLA